MPFYRKKPVVIEARKYTGENADELVRWSESAVLHKNDNGFSALVINTLEGQMLLPPGHYLIKGVQGEFYPCKPDIFAQTYEEVEEVTAGELLNRFNVREDDDADRT